MKQFKIILGLILLASVTTFAQSPRIKLNQITKDTVKGSVLISSPSDSGMVYSRDFYVAYGADTVLILYGDTLGGVGGGFASVLSDGVTVTGDGTTGNELKVDTSLIATLTALTDSLATVPTKTTPDSVTITGDGSVANPLKVDTFLISTIQGLVDTLSARGYLTANETITLSGDVTGSGTTSITATVVDDSHDHIISNVDFLQDSLNAKANDSDLANYVTIAGTDTITGAKTFTAALTQSGGDANFDSGTLFVDESANRVGIGTTAPGNGYLYDTKLHIVGNGTGTGGRTTVIIKNTDATSAALINLVNSSNAGISFQASGNSYVIGASGSISTVGGIPLLFSTDGNITSGGTSPVHFRAGGFGVPYMMTIAPTGNIGIGETNPSEKLEVNGNGLFTGNLTVNGTTLTANNYEFDIDQTVGASEDNYVLTYDSLDGQISLEPIALSGSATLDFGSTSSLNSSDLTITVTGAADGDVVSLGVPNASVNANTNYTAWVSAANTVTVRFNNYSLGAVDPASGTFKVKVFK